MAGGLVGLLDDVASLAKMAAASIDDVGAAAARASLKSAGVVVDDTAVTPTYVHGLEAHRELPIIKRIAFGSLRNKLLLILPAALLLSEFAPVLVEIVLICGGAYLGYEGAHKIHHRLTAHEDEPHLPAAAIGPEAENATVKSAVRTDFILSTEIMVIALKDVLDEGFVSRAIIMLVVALLITVTVYGVVALIVKMDDVGLRMAQSSGAGAVRIGRSLVLSMPKVLALLSTVGTAAMLWVGGHILLAASDELGWHWPYEQVHHLEESVHDVGSVGGVLGWLLNTAVSAVIGLAIGSALVLIVQRSRANAPAH